MTEQNEGGVLDAAVQKVRDQKEDKISFNVKSEENLPGSIRKIEVEVDGAEFSARVDKVLKDVKNNATIEGFRKGKAPLKLLQRRYKDAAIHDVVEKASPLIIRDYEKEKELVIYGTPSIVDYKPAEGDGPVTITLEFQIKPDIVPSNYTGLEVEAEEVKLEADMVDRKIEELRFQNTSVEESEEPAAENDYLVVDYKSVNDKGHTLEHGTDEMISAVGSKLPAEVFVALVGKKAGERVELDINGEKWNVTLKTVKKEKQPEINDDFAKDLGYEDVADMRKKVEESLQTAVNNINEEAAFEALTRKLLENHDFEIPSALKAHIEQEIFRSDYYYFTQTNSLPPRLGGSLGSENEYRASVEADATDRARGFLLLDAISKVENIKPEDADIEEALAKRAEEEGRKPAGIRAALERHRRWEQFVEEVRFSKIRKFLLDKNTVKFVEPKKEEVAEEAKAEDAKADEATEDNK